jgi:hypothetical protein
LHQESINFSISIFLTNKCTKKSSQESIAAEKILYSSVTREASVALHRKRKCFFADICSRLKAQIPSFLYVTL